MTSVATAVTSTTLRCLLPAWGSKYAATNVIFKIVQSRFGSEKRTIDFMIDGSTRFPCTLDGSCIIKIEPIISEFVAPSAGSPKGGSLIRILGSGFLVQESYSCLFVHGTDRKNSLVTTQSISELQCNSPQWLHGASMVSLHVLDKWRRYVKMESMHGKGAVECLLVPRVCL